MNGKLTIKGILVVFSLCVMSSVDAKGLGKGTTPQQQQQQPRQQQQLQQQQQPQQQQANVKQTPTEQQWEVILKNLKSKTKAAQKNPKVIKFPSPKEIY